MGGLSLMSIGVGDNGGVTVAGGGGGVGPGGGGVGPGGGGVGVVDGGGGGVVVGGGTGAGGLIANMPPSETRCVVVLFTQPVRSTALTSAREDRIGLLM